VARSLASASTEYLAHAAQLAVPPFSVSAWVRPASDVGGQSLWAMMKTADKIGYWLDFDVGGNCRFGSASISGGGFGIATITGSAPTVGNWSNFVGVAASASSKKIYLDYSTTATNATLSDPGTQPTETTIGTFDWGGKTAFVNGRVAEVAMWDVALTDGEAEALAQGVCPLFIRPANLIAYWPLGGIYGENDKDRVGGYHMTAYNTPTWDDHPRIIYPGHAIFPAAAAAASPVSTTRKVPWHLLHSGAA